MLKINRFRHVRLAIVVLLLSGMFGWTAQNAALAGNTDLWKVVEIKGDAQYNQNGSGWKPLNTGTVLKPGSRVKTGKDGRIVISRPGDTVSVSPNSHFGVPAPARKGPVTHIMQDLGTLLFKIKTRPQNPFNIKTPYLAAIIRGTTFTVSVDDSNAALHVATGAVEVHSVLSGETALVRPGETAIIDSRTGGRMKLVGANGRKPIKSKPAKKSNKTGATGSTGKAASAVQKIGNTEAMGSTGKTTGGARSAIKSASTDHVIHRAIGAGKIDLFKLTKGLINRTEGRRNRASKNLYSKRAVGSAPGAEPFDNSDDGGLTSADNTKATTSLLDETRDLATMSTTTDSLTTTTDSTTTATDGTKTESTTTTTTTTIFSKRSR